MANKTFTLVPIVPKAILHNMKTAGYSIRKLGQETSYSERSIRSYLKRGWMPEKLVCEIDNILRPKTHQIKVQFTATITVCDEQLNELMSQNGFEDVELDDMNTECLWLEKGEARFLEAHIDRRELEQYRDWYTKA